MQLIKQTKSLYKKLSSDEELLRLLFYKSDHPQDDVLSNERPDILGDMSQELTSGVINAESERVFQIINDRIKLTRKYDDLNDDNPKARICCYLGDREKSEGNYLLAKQHILIDVIVHNSFDDIDLRSSKIAERVNRLIFGEQIGIGKNLFEGMEITELVDNYQSYRLQYSTRSANQ